jgi:hypothetical protein
VICLIYLYLRKRPAGHAQTSCTTDLQPELAFQRPKCSERVRSSCAFHEHRSLRTARGDGSWTSAPAGTTARSHSPGHRTGPEGALLPALAAVQGGRHGLDGSPHAQPHRVAGLLDVERCRRSFPSLELNTMCEEREPTSFPGRSAQMDSANEFRKCEALVCESWSARHVSTRIELIESCLHFVKERFRTR